MPDRQTPPLHLAAILRPWRTILAFAASCLVLGATGTTLAVHYATVDDVRRALGEHQRGAEEAHRKFEDIAAELDRRTRAVERVQDRETANTVWMMDALRGLANRAGVTVPPIPGAVDARSNASAIHGNRLSTKDHP